MLSLWLSSSKNLNIGIVPLTSAGWNEPLGPDPQRHLNNWLRGLDLGSVCTCDIFSVCNRGCLIKHSFCKIQIHSQDWGLQNWMWWSEFLTHRNVSQNPMYEWIKQYTEHESAFQRKLHLKCPFPMYKLATVSYLLEWDNEHWSTYLAHQSPYSGPGVMPGREKSDFPSH